MDYEVARDRLPQRDKDIILLAESGWTHVTIAEQFGLSRSRVSHLIADWLDGAEL